MVEGSQVTEMVIFVVVCVSWLVYTMLYFARWKFSAHNPSPLLQLGGWNVIDVWTTTMTTRKKWAKDLMHKANDARGEAILAVQQMRNIIISVTVLVMGVSQIMSRLVELMLTQDILDTINSLVVKDPIVGTNPWLLESPEIRIAVPLGATLLCLLLLGQSARMAVHVGFAIRVVAVNEHEQEINGRSTTTTNNNNGKPGNKNSRLEKDLQYEVVVMVRRTELYFTLGLRSFYFFIASMFWVLGPTALLVASSTVLGVLISSDQLWWRANEVIDDGGGDDDEGRVLMVEE